MGRVLLLLGVLALLGGGFGAGVAVGRGGRRRSVRAATSDVRPVLVAARQLATLDWLAQPQQAALARTETLAALDRYDERRRDELYG